MPAILRVASVALEESVPSSILMPLLKFAVKVIFEKAGFARRDIAIGSDLQFIIETLLTTGVELFSHLRPKL